MVPLVRPVTVQEVPVVEQVAPPGEAVAVYDAMPAPVFAGAVQATVALESPATATAPVGGSGGPGLTDADGALAGEVPPGPVATTVNV